MAQIIPLLKYLPVNTPASEKKVLQSLADSLGATWLILHSVSFIQEDDLKYREGEADIVLFHPTQGILILEIKGGGISYNDHQWYTENRRGRFPIKNPFDQARRAKHVLLDLIKQKLGSVYVDIGYAVAFPDCTLPPGLDLPADVKRTLVIDASVLGNAAKLSQSIENALSQWVDHPPEKSTLKEIQHRVLCPKFRLVPSQKLSLAGVEEIFLQLTEQQYMLLDVLDAHKKAVIEGGAGTGKTMLLLEKARRLSERGCHTLLLCYNVKLGNYLRQATQSLSNISVFTFHELCENLVKKAKLPYVIPEDNVGEFYSNNAPEQLLNALESGLVPNYDAILVDEAQDFEPHWWLPIEMLLEKSEACDEGAILYLFADPAQSLFTEGFSSPVNVPPFNLSRNCRNTQEIAAWLQDHFSHAAQTNQACPKGEIPIIHYWNDYNEQLTQLSESITRLLTDGYGFNEILVLTPFNPDNSIACRGIQQEFPGIRCESIMAFKGLEAPIVLLCDIGKNEYNQRKDLLYAGASRAQYLLHIYSHQSFRI